MTSRTLSWRVAGACAQAATQNPKRTPSCRQARDRIGEFYPKRPFASRINLSLRNRSNVLVHTEEVRWIVARFDSGKAAIVVAISRAYALVALFRTLGLNVFESAFAQGLTSDPLDKTISYTVVFLILGALPLTVRTMFSRGETTVAE